MVSINVGNPTFLAPAALGYSKTAQDAEDSVARLTSGTRILRPKDDAASLSIANQLQTQELKYRQAAQDITRADTLLDVASAGVSSIKEKLETAAELAEQAADEETTDSDRLFLQQQLSGLLQEIDNAVEETSFDGQQLLDGSFTDKDIRVGPEDTDFINVSISNLDTETLFSDSLPDISSEADAATAETQIEEAIEIVGTIEGQLNGAQDVLFSANANASATLAGVTQARSALTDTNVEEELRKLAQSEIQLDIGSAVIAQARRLSDQLLNVLDFRIEIDKQSEDDEAEDDTAESQSLINTSTNANLSADTAQTS